MVFVLALVINDYLIFYLRVLLHLHLSLHPSNINHHFSNYLLNVETAITTNIVAVVIDAISIFQTFYQLTLLGVSTNLMSAPVNSTALNSSPTIHLKIIPTLLQKLTMI